MPVNIGVNIQRSPNRINQQLREAGVEGKFPKLLLDFKDQYYLASGGSKTLANAVTHARSGNATMTDGYGPELVVNGGFLENANNWTAQSCDISSVNQKLQVVSDGFSEGAYQNVTTEAGKTYIVNFYLISSTLLDANVTVRAYPSGDFSGSYETAQGRDGYLVFTATGTSSRIFLVSNGAGTTEWDSVSVREMPVLKWAPHNLLTYSEDLSNWSNAWSGGVTLTSNASTAPDGTTTADRIAQLDATSDGIFASFTPTSNTEHRAAVFLKAGTAARSSVFLYETTGGTYPAILNITWTSGVPSTFNSTNATDISYTSVGDGWYLVSYTFTSDSGSHRLVVQPATSATGTDYIDVWGAHLYRSDLGGMVDNPDRGDSYVPTTSAAKYLPRIGHHVYNGSAWVNEGLLAESESRTNLLPYSTPDSNWNNSNSTDTANQAIAPDGTETATLIVDNAVNQNHYMESIAVNTAGSGVTGSMYIKKESLSFVRLRLDNTTHNSRAWFDIENGTVGTVDTYGVATIQDVGNGWFRCSLSEPNNSLSGNKKLQVFLQTADNQTSYTGDGSSGLYVWGAQLEQASTPSSFIPTDAGASVTRAAETFTIPSANLPWPSPNYISSELVTNGTFDTASDWTLAGASVISGGVLSLDRDGLTGAPELASQFVNTTTATNLYWVSFDITALSHGVTAVFRDGGTVLATESYTTTGTKGFSFISEKSAANQVVSFKTINSNDATATIDNVSVREIDPLSVSIAMDGRMTFADTNDANEALHYRWFDDIENRIQAFLSTYGTLTGGIYSYMEYQDTADSAGTAGDYYTPDILTPYNMAARYGSTFVNAAHEGVALTADTTPVGLPDLSSIDMTIAHGYMGTVGSVRIWDRDIGDTGLVEATNPSLEPSLSLTFEGTGTNSFIVNDWSE